MNLHKKIFTLTLLACLSPIFANNSCEKIKEERHHLELKSTSFIRPADVVGVAVAVGAAWVLLKGEEQNNTLLVNLSKRGKAVLKHIKDNGDNYTFAATLGVLTKTLIKGENPFNKPADALRFLAGRFLPSTLIKQNN